MSRTTDEAVEWLINTVKTALEEGRTTASELEDWLLAAISLEEMAMEEEADAREARTFSQWMGPAGTVH